MLGMNAAPDPDHRCLSCSKFAEKVSSLTVFTDVYTAENKEVLLLVPQLGNYCLHTQESSSFT